MTDKRVQKLLPQDAGWLMPVLGSALSTAACLSTLIELASTVTAEAIVLATVSAVLVIAWVFTLQYHSILHTDQAVPLSLLGAGLLCIAISLVPEGMRTAAGMAFSAVSLVLLLAYLYRRNGCEPPVEPGYSRELMVKPLAYLIVYGVTHGLAFGILGVVCSGTLADMDTGLFIAAGLIVGAGVIEMVRALVAPAKGIEILTRLTFIILMSSLLMTLQPLYLEAVIALFGIGLGTFLFLLLRMSIDLQQAFGFKRRFLVLIAAAFAASLMTGCMIGLLLDAASLVISRHTFITIACVVAITIVTVYGLSSERVWTAHDLQPPNPTTHKERAMGSWKQACIEVGRAYKLTQREQEVFELLAKGRNAAYIEKALVITNHTVKSHSLNIYRKLDIHSQQELINMVERANRTTGQIQ